MSDKNIETVMQHKEKYIKQIKAFRLIDDTFMTAVFADDIECTELLLSIILSKNLKVIEVHTQATLKNLYGHSVRLDIVAVDVNGKIYNIEIQRSNAGAEKKRARYNSSIIDANILDIGEKYEKLPESYVIFITENDVLGKGKPIYHINRYIEETGELFGDGQHIIYVNSQVQDETALGKLMHDFYCTDAKDMNYDVLADKVKHFKENEEGVGSMCRAMEILCQEAAAEAAAEAAVRSAVEMCQEFGATMAEAVEKIMNKFNLSEDDAKNNVKKFWYIQ